MFDFIKTLFGFGRKTALYQQRVPQWDDFIESVRANSNEKKSTVVIAVSESETLNFSSQCEIAIEDITFPEDLSNERNSVSYESNDCGREHDSLVVNSDYCPDSFYNDSTSSVSDF